MESHEIFVISMHFHIYILHLELFHTLFDLDRLLYVYSAKKMKGNGGIGQSVLAGTRSESRRAGKWVRKASNDDW